MNRKSRCGLNGAGGGNNREKTLKEWFATATKEQHEAVIELFVEEELGRKRN